MSLENKLTGWSDYAGRTFSRLLGRLGAYSLVLGIALNGANYGCGKQEDEDNSVQRYNCAMNECLPDPNGPYAVANCNNECGTEKDGGNGQQMDYFNVTKDGMSECDWGWSAVATFSPQMIRIEGTCKSSYILEFSPVPPPSGGSAPCSYCEGGWQVISGSLTLSGGLGAYRVNGNCHCGKFAADTNPPEVYTEYTAEFDLPLEGAP